MWKWFRRELPEDIRKRDLLEAQTLLLEYEKNVEWFGAMASAMRTRIARLQGQDGFLKRAGHWEATEKGLNTYGKQTQQT